MQSRLHYWGDSSTIHMTSDRINQSTLWIPKIAFHLGGRAVHGLLQAGTLQGINLFPVVDGFAYRQIELMFRLPTERVCDRSVGSHS